MSPPSKHLLLMFLHSACALFGITGCALTAPESKLYKLKPLAVGLDDAGTLGMYCLLQNKSDAAVWISEFLPGYPAREVETGREKSWLEAELPMTSDAAKIKRIVARIPAKGERVVCFLLVDTDVLIQARLPLYWSPFLAEGAANNLKERLALVSTGFLLPAKLPAADDELLRRFEEANTPPEERAPAARGEQNEIKK